MNKQEEQVLNAVISDFKQSKGRDPKSKKEITDFIQEQGGQKYLEQKMASFTKSARHGAKLQYIKFLKHQCAEDEELVYFKKGGSIVDCGCSKKKENGGEIKKAQNGAVANFKNRTKAQQDKINKQSEEDYFNGTADHTKPGTPQKPVQKFKTRSKAEQERINKQSEKDYFAGTADHTKPGVKKVSKKACGSKIKKDCNGAVAKFKAACGSKIKKNQQGGSLNGTPFIRKVQ